MAHGGEQQDARFAPLLRRDPPAVADIVLRGRLGTHDAGLVYAGEQAGEPVAVVMLTAGAESDPYARARFHDAAVLLELEQSGIIRGGDDDPDIAPWVALAAGSWTDGQTLGRRLLCAVTLEDRPPIGQVEGPDFRPHWYERINVGRWRLWPLPWPARLSAAGRWTFLVSFALVVAIAAIALWIVIKVFENQAPPPPGPGPGPGPVPPPTSPSPTPTPTPTPTLGPQPTSSGPPSTGTTVPPIV